MRAALAIASLSLLAAAVQAKRPVAQTVLLNGTIITVDAADSIAQALAISDGTIVAVGSNAEIRALAGPKTRVIDLHGRTVTPGLIDTHFHMDGSAAYEVDAAYPAVRSIADIVEGVRARAATLRPGEWILGRGWDEGKLEERRYVYASDLDRAAPDNPVFLSHATGHYAAVNSLALRIAGIVQGTADPPAGTIDRDAAGMATGVLKERATALVLEHVPPYSAQQQRQGFARVLRDLNGEGLTAIKDPGISEEKWGIYRDMLREGELTARVFVLWETKGTVDDAQALIDRAARRTRPYERALNDGRLVAGGVKLFLDGSGGARTAWLHAEWNREYTGTDAGNHGYPLIDPQTYRKIVGMFHDAGVHVGTHAIGDRAIDLAVDTYADVLRANPVRGLRHAIIHANVPTDRAIRAMASLQERYDAGYPETQPGFMWWIGDVYAGNFGKARDLRLMPFKSYLDAHVIWAAGSDYDVTPLAPRYGIWASTERETLKGTYGSHPFGVSQSIDVRTALRSYSIWAARQLFLEDRIGSLETGKQADIAVWSRNPYSVPAAAIKDMKCELTVLAGRIVFQAADSPLSVR